MMLYLRRPQPPIYFSRKVNGLVGRLVSWPRFEPATSGSSLMCDQMLIQFGYGAQAMSRYILVDFRNEFEQTVQFLSTIDDANIARMLGVCRQSEPLCILIEYLSFGDLRQFLRQRVFDDGSDSNKHGGPPTLRSANMRSVSISGVVLPVPHIAYNMDKMRFRKFRLGFKCLINRQGTRAFLWPVLPNGVYHPSSRN